MSDNFKQSILRWEELNRKIKETNLAIEPYQKKIKSYKEKAGILEKKIVDYMKVNQMGGSKLELGDVVITMGETKRTESVSRDYLLKKCCEFLQNEKIAKKLVDYVYDSRQQNINNCLRRKEPTKKHLKNQG